MQCSRLNFCVRPLNNGFASVGWQKDSNLGLIASINIKTYKAPPVSQTLSLLRASGWELWEGVLRYRHFGEDGDIGDYEEAPPQEWERVCRDMDRWSEAGEKVGVDLPVAGG